MAVEKRYGRRVPIRADVYIHYRRQRIFHARAVNCSANGICLSAKNLSLPKGMLVELDIVHGGNTWPVKGVIVHTAVNEVGIMFRTPQPVLFEVASLRSAYDETISSSPPPSPVEERAW